MKIETIFSVKHDTDNLMIRDGPVSYTIVDIPGYDLAIIDTGCPDNPHLLAELARPGYTPADFSLVINTPIDATRTLRVGGEVGGRSKSQSANIAGSGRGPDLRCS